MNYPKDFLWGAATSSHQVEGNNTNNDWWQWEQQGRIKTPSGAAVAHFEHFNDDFKLAAELAHNSHRFSVEWSRVEPREGRFDFHAIDHYKDIIASLKTKFITPVVTLHHFTVPLWFQKQGGWLSPRAASFFSRFSERIVSALGENVCYWITINEPMVYALYAFCQGIWPPGEKSAAKGFRVVNNMVRAHRRVYQNIHNIYKERNWDAPQVGFAKNFRPFLVCPKTRDIFCQMGVFWRQQYFNFYFLNRIKTKTDFIGVNYYELEYDSTDARLNYGILGGNCTHAHKHLNHQNQLGWGLFPEGLKIVFDWLKKYNKPILITENGTCEDDDAWRGRFIEEHIRQIDRAVDEGIPVIGYLYWSLLDNFEWHHGFSPRFGLIEVDYQTFKRAVRPSALRYKELIEARRNKRG